MAFIYREWRTLGAALFAVLAIGGAYLLASGSAAPRRAEASTETELLNQIATKDSTGDGLPDWQKALYGIPTNATTTDYFHLGMTDGEAVAKGLIIPIAATPSASGSTSSTGAAASFGLSSPAAGSLTDTFAKSFFALYVSAAQQNNGALSSAQINDIATQALAQLSAGVTPTPDFKTAKDINSSGSGAAALMTYAGGAEAVFAAHGAKLPESELQYLGDYLNDSTDTAALTSIGQLAAAYQDTATGLAALAVPKEAAKAQLALVNALARVGQAATDFGHVDTDPLAAMLALQQYPQFVTQMINAFLALNQVFLSEQVAIPAKQPGSQFLILVANITKGKLNTPAGAK